MATNTRRVLLGIDVSKTKLDVNVHGAERVEQIDNEACSIDACLKRYLGAAIAVEATNTYHCLLVERALKRGLVVYLLSGYQLKHYAKGVGYRMRNDAIDARLISRYLAHEIDRLKPYEPKSPQHERLWMLLKRRATVIQSRQQLQQSLSGINELRVQAEQFRQTYAQVVADLEARMETLVDELGWRQDVKRLLGMPGVGPLTAIALVMASRSGTFIHHDPFIAYLGLDVRAKDSGTFRGQRKLTKQGDGEYRRLLYCAAMAARRTPGYFQARYEALQARGLTSTAALVIIARKLATVAFHLLRKQEDFDPAQLTRQAAA